MELLILFISLNIVNVILQTIKSIATVKCGKVAAAIVNAVAYGLYTVVIVYTNCELPLISKVLVVAITNLIGVYVVKVIEEKVEKERLWKVEATITNTEFEKYKDIFKNVTVPHNYIDIGNYKMLNFYCSTKKQSEAVKVFLADCNAKYFVSESKTL